MAKSNEAGPTGLPYGRGADVAYFCRRGHVTPVHQASEPEYARVCRRLNMGDGTNEHWRCHAPVRRLCDYPEIEAAFQLGGEEAVWAIVQTWQFF